MNINDNNRIWVTWEKQRRNKSLSMKLNAKYYEINDNNTLLIRYIINIIKTIFLYKKVKPKIIFVQNPSIILTILTIFYSKIRKIPVIVDAHNAGIFPLDGKSDILNYITKHIFKSATLTIVSNNNLAKYVNDNGGRAFVLPDPLPSFKKYLIENIKNNYNSILFICTWANDEPYQEVIKAAELIDKSITIHMTGNSKGKEKLICKTLPENIKLTGYISDIEYISLLYSSSLVMDLTTRDDCMVCGAYESVKAEKPLILSDKKVLREYFHKGVVYTKNNHIDIARSIKLAFKTLETLTSEIKELKIQIEKEWELSHAEMEIIIKNLSTKLYE